MRKGTKFINTDILKVMKGIVDSHVKHYQSDFDIDTELTLVPDIFYYYILLLLY